MADALAVAAIAIDDPLAAGTPAGQRWIYLFHDPAGTDDPAPEPLLRYDAEAREIHAPSYVLGFASSAVEDDGFFGLKRISLLGDLETDLVDRTKFRANVDAFGQQLALTEENLANVLGQFGGGDIEFDIEPVKAGPVRAVLSAAGGSAWPHRAALSFAPGGGGPIQIPITDMRLSPRPQPQRRRRGGDLPRCEPDRGRARRRHARRRARVALPGLARAGPGEWPAHLHWGQFRPAGGRHHSGHASVPLPLHPGRGAGSRSGHDHHPAT